MAVDLFDVYQTRIARASQVELIIRLLPTVASWTSDHESADPLLRTEPSMSVPGIVISYSTNGTAGGVVLGRVPPEPGSRKVGGKVPIHHGGRSGGRIKPGGHGSPGCQPGGKVNPGGIIVPGGKIREYNHQRGTSISSGIVESGGNRSPGCHPSGSTHHGGISVPGGIMIFGGHSKPGGNGGKASEGGRRLVISPGNIRCKSRQANAWRAHSG
ncbi:hypothetical protein LCGC14_0817820 [marine sediment metagenome]|uniref:Uncharacterized protein n=1 Tax=marine sediment metagenome TaxID=412755 RepID=A0A0F9SS77_9ZZZZ